MALVGLISVTALQVEDWLEDDTEDVNVNLIQYSLLTVEVLSYLLLALVACIANTTSLKVYCCTILTWAIVQWAWFGTLAFNGTTKEVL